MSISYYCLLCVVCLLSLPDGGVVVATDIGGLLSGVADLVYAVGGVATTFTRPVVSPYFYNGYGGSGAGYVPPPISPYVVGGPPPLNGYAGVVPPFNANVPNNYGGVYPTYAAGVQPATIPLIIPNGYELYGNGIQTGQTILGNLFGLLGKK